jgi:hypothetical protein
MDASKKTKRRARFSRILSGELTQPTLFDLHEVVPIKVKTSERSLTLRNVTELLGIQIFPTLLHTSNKDRVPTILYDPSQIGALLDELGIPRRFETLVCSDRDAKLVFIAAKNFYEGLTVGQICILAVKAGLIPEKRAEGGPTNKRGIEIGGLAKRLGVGRTSLVSAYDLNSKEGCSDLVALVSSGKLPLNTAMGRAQARMALSQIENAPAIDDNNSDSELDDNLNVQPASDNDANSDELIEQVVSDSNSDTTTDPSLHSMFPETPENFPASPQRRRGSRITEDGVFDQERKPVLAHPSFARHVASTDRIEIKANELIAAIRFSQLPDLDESARKKLIASITIVTDVMRALRPAVVCECFNPDDQTINEKCERCKGKGYMNDSDFSSNSPSESVA